MTSRAIRVPASWPRGCSNREAASEPGGRHEARQTSCSRGEVLRRCLTGVQLKSTIDAQALTEVSRVHANLNRIGGLLKLAIREGVSDPSSYRRLDLELVDSVIQVRRAVERLTGQR